MATKITVWKDRANATSIQLLKNGTALTVEEMAAITKVGLIYKGTEYNSDDYPEAFDLSTEAATGSIVIKPGLLGWEVGQDNVEIVIYDAVNVEGIIWLQIKAKIQTTDV
jgi:hypothetical protein